MKLTRRHAVGGVLAAAGALGTEPWRLFAQSSPSASPPPAAASGRVWALSKETLAHRMRLMRELMDREGLDALAFSSWLYLKFAANFNGFAGGEAVCVVPRNGEPFLILPASAANSWRFQAGTQRLWISDVTLSEVSSASFTDALTAKIERAGLRRARIGLESV